MYAHHEDSGSFCRENAPPALEAVNTHERSEYSAADALEIALKTPPAVVLTDVMMPPAMILGSAPFSLLQGLTQELTIPLRASLVQAGLVLTLVQEQ